MGRSELWEMNSIAIKCPRSFLPKGVISRPRLHTTKSPKKQKTLVRVDKNTSTGKHKGVNNFECPDT